MKPDHATAATTQESGRTRRVFTVETANRALVLVRRIVQEIVDRYAEMMTLRAEREELAEVAGAGDRAEALRVRIEQRIARLNELQEELNEIGVELKDFATGLVDFPGEYQNRPVSLCWRLGEAAVENWHEPEAGFAGRQPIGPDFTTQA